MLKKVISTILATVVCFLALPIGDIVAYAADTSTFSQSEICAYTASFVSWLFDEKGGNMNKAVPLVNNTSAHLVLCAPSDSYFIDDYDYKVDNETSSLYYEKEYERGSICVKVGNDLYPVYNYSHKLDEAENDKFPFQYGVPYHDDYYDYYDNNYYPVDSVSLLYFINRIHTLYHSKEVWSLYLGESKTDTVNKVDNTLRNITGGGYSTYNGNQLECKCKSTACPVMHYMSVYCKTSFSKNSVMKVQHCASLFKTDNADAMYKTMVYSLRNVDAKLKNYMSADKINFLTYSSDSPYDTALSYSTALAANGSSELRTVETALNDLTDLMSDKVNSNAALSRYRAAKACNIKEVAQGIDTANVPIHVSFEKVLFYYLEKVCAYDTWRLSKPITKYSTKQLIQEKQANGYFSQSIRNMVEDYDTESVRIGTGDIKVTAPSIPFVEGAEYLWNCMWGVKNIIYGTPCSLMDLALADSIIVYDDIDSMQMSANAQADKAIQTVSLINKDLAEFEYDEQFPGFATLLIPYLLYNPDAKEEEIKEFAKHFYDTYHTSFDTISKNADKYLKDTAIPATIIDKFRTKSACETTFMNAYYYYKQHKNSIHTSLYKGFVKYVYANAETGSTQDNEQDKYWEQFKKGLSYNFLSSKANFKEFYENVKGDPQDNYRTFLTKYSEYCMTRVCELCPVLHSKYYFLLKGSGKPIYKEYKNALVEPGTVVIERARDELYAKYQAAKEMQLSGLGDGAFTLKARADLLDLYAEYGLVQDDIIKEVIAETTANTAYTDVNGKVVQLPVYLEWESSRYLDFAKSDIYFYYQLLLVSECTKYAGNIIFLLGAGMNGGTTTTYEGLSNEILMLEYIQDIINRYPTPNGNSLWLSMLGGVDAELAKAWEEKYPDKEPPSLNFVYQHYLRAGLIGNVTSDFEIYNEDDPLSILWTITGGNVLFDSDYYKGRALSATYVPMQDNLYDPYSMLDYVDPEFIEDFHYKYGFYRKALMIDKNTDAAIDLYTSNTHGEKRVATLADLMNPAKDIVLYLDTNFYNLAELADKQEKAYDRLANDPNVWRDMWTSFTSLLGFMNEVDFDVIMKHGATNLYSTEVFSNNSGLTYTPPETEESKSYWNNDTFYDDIILDKWQINTYLSKQEYTPMKGYAIVSTIYRDKDNFAEIARICNENKPVFVSSPTLWCLAGVDDTTRECVYNYALLKNLSTMTTVGYDTSLDMTSPLYIDVYGNISTESGTIVIPAASNATLHKGGSNAYQPINTGFLSTYGKEWSIPLDTTVPDEWMEKFFVKNEEENRWDIAAKTIRGVPMNIAQLSYSDVATNIAIMNWYKFDIVNGKMMDQDVSLNIVHEVMRGAPLEFIDADEEGLNPNRDISKQGLIAAAKLDQFINSLNWDDDNSVTGMPNLSFIPNYQYVVTFVFKVLLVIIVIALMVTVYIDAVRQTISGRTILKCVSTLLVGVGSVLLIPTAFEISYYQSNKLLLQDEAGYIMLMNTEKNMSGREIGITEVTEPEQNTKIYIKLENYEFDWISVLPDVIFGDSVAALDQAYGEFLESSLIAGMDNVQAMNDGIYMDVQDIFDTSVVNFDTHSKSIYQKVSVDPVASYYLPYYYFLDALITNINDYNVDHNVYAYSTKIMRGGYVKTINLCDAYFNSPTFMESEGDTLGLRQLYDIQGSVYIAPIFSEEAVDQARSSQWYTGTYIDSENLEKRIGIMHDKVRRWVSENRDVIGRITDESFLKVLAMEMAVEYNNLFGMPNATAYEIYDLSNADLMRLVVCDKETTLEDSPMSFARFVYNEAGTPGVIAGIFLTVITLFTSFMRTILTIAILVLLIVSVYVFKILLRKSNNSVAGYFATLGVICATNILYAIVLKISIAIPSTGLAPTICIILQILIQLAYLVVLGAVLIFAIRDWRNFGYNQYQMVGTGIKNKFQSWRHKNGHGGGGYNPADDRPRGVNGWDYLNKLEDNFKKKQKKVGR